ncbi:exosome complex protein Rrp42 [Candidatus Woesearchaeota archaeon]|nr:exosome complex protein Rrp42 [Candidatus Woesearchaeota archaeon]
MITKSYTLKLAKKGERVDGRKFTEYRKPIKIEYGISAKSAEGSARVTIGNTEVVAGVKMNVESPFPDMPDEGTLVVNAELRPIASKNFENGPPGIDSIELSRIVDRGIRESGALDFKKLCIVSKEKVWVLFVDIYPLNADGNLFDASALAAMAALKDAKFPKFDGEAVDYSQHEDHLELEKVPLACTVFKIGESFIIDPTDEEELNTDARLTIAITEEGKICAMQKGGTAELSEDDINSMVEIAVEKVKELRKYL